VPASPSSRRASRLAGVVALVIGIFLVGALFGGPVRDALLPSRDSVPDQVADLITQRYEGPVDRAKLERAAAIAMAEEVGDRWTTYFTPEQWQALQRATEGQYTGIGVTIRSDDDALVIRQVYPRSPAASAGLEPGDAIVAVGGVPVSRRGPVRSREAILGAPGSAVTLRVRAPGGAVRTVRVTRGDVTVPLVEARMVTGRGGAKVAYIDLNRFERGAGEQVRQQATRLIGEGATAVVLDLRGDPGGLLDEGVAVAGVFLEPGKLVVSTEGRASPRREFTADGDPIPADIPVAVLVDGASASASEIVAGALKDYDRAVVVGQPTLGKSKVQVTQETTDGGAIRVTIAGYRTPKGKDIADGGVTPSVRVSDNPGTDRDEALEAALGALATQRP
jgi:carboxyl-terminal processing protease